MTGRATPKAVVVWFADLERWSVGSFIELGWKWPRNLLRPLSDVLRRKTVEVNRKSEKKDAIKLVTIRFDGSMELRKTNGSQTIAGQLWWADVGDMVYSKIDVRNGAIGIVPEELGRVSVTSEFPVYAVDDAVADARYIKLLFRTTVFRRKVNSMISGTSGRKRVQPTDLESLEVPIPLLSTQQAIAAIWENAQAEINKSRRLTAQIEDQIESDFLSELGLASPQRSTLLKGFSVPWQDFERWSVSFNQLAQTGIDLNVGQYHAVKLGSCISRMQYGTSEKANTQGKGVVVLRINNIKNGSIDLSDVKHIALPEKTKESLLLKDGDILIIRTSGSRDLVGTCAVFHNDVQCVFASYLIRLQIDEIKADPDYVAFFLNSSLGRQGIDALSRQIMQNNINSEELRSLLIPLPPISIQKKLVEKIKSQRHKIGQLKAEVDQRAVQIKADVNAMIIGEQHVTA